MLEKLHRYEEAIQAFEQALDRNCAENTAGRDEVLFRLALASFNAGWPEKTMMSAERVIEAGVSEPWLYLAHRLAGSASSNLGRLDLAHYERRMQAVLNMNMATHRALLGRLDQASDNLCAATGELSADPKLALVCEAAWACLMARRGDRESALWRTNLVLQELDEHSRDGSTRLDCLEQIGQAMLLTGEFERAKECWERFLATTHPPVAEPTGRYHLGVCQWHLGDPDAARGSFRRAAAQGINSYHARLAEERLHELSKAVGNEIL